ncbi:hypothetical protein ACET3Z_006459 [Daucus carota]
MVSPGRIRNPVKREAEENPDLKSDRVKEEEEWDGDDKRKHRSSRSKRSGNGEDSEGVDSSARKRSGDRNESRKRSAGSSRIGGSDEDDYESKKELRSKQMKKKQDESALEKLSNWYQDGEAADNKHDGVNKSGKRGHGRADEHERHGRADEHERHGRADENERKDLASKLLDQDNIQSKNKVKNERVNDVEIEKGDRSSKGRDDSWSNRQRNREDSRDNWRRRQPNIHDKDFKDGDTVYDHGRERDLQRRGRDWIDNDRPQGRFGGRKDGIRTEAVKTSSNYGIENYDVIEIQTKSFDYAREEPKFPSDRSNEAGQQADTKLPPNDKDDAYQQENRAGKVDLYGSGQPVEDSKDRFMDDGPSRDQNSWRGEIDSPSGNARGEKGARFNAGKANGQSSSGGSQPRHVNEETGSFNRAVPGGNRGNRIGGRGRGRPTGRENQQIPMPVPMVGSPFGPLGMPPHGAMPPLNHNMSPGPGPPIPPGVFIPPFSPPVVWPGPRGMDMNMLGVPPGISPVPPGPSGPRFSPNIGPPPNPAMFYNQPGSGRGGSPNMSGVNFNVMVPSGRGQTQEKPTGGWVPPRSNVPHGKAPSRGEQNDYSQNFVDTGMRPQNYIRELELTSVVEDYPKLRELIQKKDEIVTNSATAPMYYKSDLREQVLSPEFFGTKFDVILVDPPWEEYVHRAPGVTDHMESWTFEEIQNLKIEAIADTPSFIFLWVGDGLGLEQGRLCLKKWGFRRCEDICWVKTNKTTATPGLRHDSRTLFQRSKEHCLMGIKGTVRRSTDGHIIHANIDTDVIIAEEPPYGSTAKPEDMYRIIEHFCLGRRRLELFGEDHNIRSGWLTVGKDLSSSNFNSEAYIRNFADKDGKIWQGGGGRNPPPEAGHLVVTTPDIESLRPKSPMKNQLQMQQQHSNSITLTSANSGNKRPGNMPQMYNGPGMSEEASNSFNNPPQMPWPPQMEGFRGGDVGVMGSEDKVFDMYGYNAPFVQPPGDYPDYESHRSMNML